MIHDDWVYPTNKQYQANMVDLMEFFHGCVDYPSDKVFTREELLELEPMDIHRWLANKAFGDPDYNVELGDRPIYARSSTLEFLKKAVSFFMPHQPSCWVEGMGGNPTKSKIVNQLLREVKALETRTEARSVRPVTEAEFRRTIQLFHGQTDWRTKCKFTTMALLQYHLIAQMVDIAHFETNDLKSHPIFDFSMQAKVRRSRQASQEQQQQQPEPPQQPASPDHILFGSIDSMSCIITNLGLYLESILRNSPQSKYLFASNASSTSPKQLLQIYRSRLETVVFQSPNFRALCTGDPRSVCSTQSYRKFPCQYAIDKGASQEEVEIRSQWKKRGRRFASTNTSPDPVRLFMDAKVASLLCMGGPIKYKLRPDIVISDEWLFENIVPNIHRRFPEDPTLCKMFALAILCAAMDRDATGIHVPMPIRGKVTQAYAGLGFDEMHPVIKVPLNVYNMGEQLRIDEAVPVSATTPMQGSIPIQAMLLRMDRLERTTADYHRQHQESIQRMEQTLVAQLSTINSSICRIGGAVLDALANRPAMMGNPRQSQQFIQCQDLPALLSKNPRSLMDLWKEYKFGINGHKPAEHFTTAERNSRVGGIKQKYYRRRIIWECMERLVRRGDSPQVASNKIYLAYGRELGVTQIINLMIRDKPTGGHPSLR